MADASINSLNVATTLDDDSLFVTEQQGQAKSVSGEVFKKFVKQSVDQYAVDAKTDADRAEAAANSIVNMRVGSQTLPSGAQATVTKTIEDNVVKLNFGLPAGQKGDRGRAFTYEDFTPEQLASLKGAKGDTGKGLVILGYYDTLNQLKTQHPNPEAGEAYCVGVTPPYHLYIYDAINFEWVDNGEISVAEGGGSSLPPGGTVGQALLKQSNDDYDATWGDVPNARDAVTTQGGASIDMEEAFGPGPHQFEIVETEDEWLEATDIEYDNQTTGMTAVNVQEAVDELFTSVSNGKTLVASAVTDKGIPTSSDATYQQIANNIRSISGASTEDATADMFDILAGKTAYVASGKVEGVIPSLNGQTIVPTTVDQTIANGQYLAGTQVIKGDANLTSSNIRQGITLFGVEGAMTSSFQATVNVTVDRGAVVTATHTETGEEVTGVCLTGAITLELPLEGEWSITAIRGTAIYNIVVINVASSFNVTITAELHVEYFNTIDGVASYFGTASQTENYAFFAGGRKSDETVISRYRSSTTTSNWTTAITNYYDSASKEVYAYDRFLVSSKLSDLSYLYYGYAELDNYNWPRVRTSAGRVHLSSCIVGHENFVVAGGENSSAVGYDVKVGIDSGGEVRKRSTYLYSFPVNFVDCYSSSLTKTTLDALSSTKSNMAASSIENYGIFAGGYNKNTNSYKNSVDSYNEELTKIDISVLGGNSSCLSASSNQNYAIFGGGKSTGTNYSKIATAYDKYLTRTVPTLLSKERSDLSAAQAGNYVLFCGGRNGDGASDVVDAYDLFLTRTMPQRLSQARYYMSATTLNGFAVFSGGTSDGSTPIDVTEYYDPFLTHVITSPLANAKYGSSSAVIDDYIIVENGGETDNRLVWTADVYRYI